MVVLSFSQHLIDLIALKKIIFEQEKLVQDSQWQALIMIYFLMLPLSIGLYIFFKNA